MLEVQLLEAGAKAPVVGHSGEDLGYDIFALEDTVLHHGIVTQVRTGIAVAAYKARIVSVWAGEVGVGQPRAKYAKDKTPLGLMIEDRSSMANKGITKSGGVIDAGYRGEIKVLLTYWQQANKWGGYPVIDAFTYIIHAGDKIAQMRPVEVLTGEVFAVGQLEEAARGAAGFGSTGK